MSSTPYQRPVPLGRDPNFTLTCIKNVFDDLNEQGIRYCHWKSNARLDKALRAETDFDLLIDPAHKDRFNRILRQHNLKRVRPAEGKEYPGIERWIGFDPDSGSIFHLHNHYKLVLGEQLIKNYHLPLEKLLLDSTKTQFGIKIPEPELELIIMSLRTLFKYRDRDAFRDLIASDNMGIPEHVRKEITWLLTRISPDRFSYFLSEVSEVLPVDAVQEFLRVFVNNPGAWPRFLILRSRIRKALLPYQIEKRHKALFQYYREVIRRKYLQKTSPKRRMSLANGGMRIAFIGPTGSGKTTIIKDVSRWLSPQLTVRTYYMGSSKPSNRTRLVKAAAKLFQGFHTRSCKLFGRQNFISRSINHPRRFLLYLRYLSESRDRYDRFLESRKEFARGGIIFYDHYPLEAVQLAGRFVDGPRILPATGSGSKDRGKAILEKMSGIEEEYYRQINQPDHVFILQADSHRSRSRKTDHQSQMIEEKNIAFEQMEREGMQVTDIRVNEPLERTIQKVRSALWEIL